MVKRGNMHVAALLCCCLAFLAQAQAATLLQACQKLGTRAFYGALQVNQQAHVTDAFEGTLLAPGDTSSQPAGDQLLYHILPTATGLRVGRSEITQVPDRTVTVAGDNSTWYFLGVANATSFVSAPKANCTRFNKAATLCKISRPLDIPQESVYDFINKTQNLTSLKAVVDAQPQLKHFLQNVNNTGTLMAPTDEAISILLQQNQTTLDQWKNTTQAFNAINELVGLVDPRTELPWNANNTLVNGQKAMAVYIDARRRGELTFLSSVPSNRSNAVAAVLSMDQVAGKSLVWTLDRVPMPTVLPNAASGNNTSNSTTVPIATPTPASSGQPANASSPTQIPAGNGTSSRAAAASTALAANWLVLCLASMVSVAALVL